MMPIEVVERFGSRRNQNGTIEFLYLATGSDDEEALRLAVLEEAPAAYGTVEKTGLTDLEQQGNGLWFATVAYASGASAFSTEPRQAFEFDSSSGTMHILEAIYGTRTVASYGITGELESDVPDFGTAINVDSDGNIEGVDVGVKALDFSVTRKFPISEIDAAALQTIYDLSWHYNKEDPIAITLLPGVTITFPAGTILFKGCRGGGQEGDLISITYLLSFSPNYPPAESSLEIPTKIDDQTIPPKLGWQYMWVYRVPTEITVGGSGGKKWLVPKAKQIIIDDLYFGADLTALNLEGGS